MKMLVESLLRWAVRAKRSGLYIAKRACVSKHPSIKGERIVISIRYLQEKRFGNFLHFTSDSKLPLF